MMKKASLLVFLTALWALPSSADNLTNHSLVKKISGLWQYGSGKVVEFSLEEYGDISVFDDSATVFDFSADPTMKYSVLQSGDGPTVILWYFTDSETINMHYLEFSDHGRTMVTKTSDGETVTVFTRAAAAENKTLTENIRRLRGKWRIRLFGESADNDAVWSFTDQYHSTLDAGPSKLDFYELDIRLDGKSYEEMTFKAYSSADIEGAAHLLLKTKDDNIVNFPIVFEGGSLVALKVEDEFKLGYKFEPEDGDSYGLVFEHPDSGVWVVWVATVNQYTGGFRANVSIRVVSGDCSQRAHETSWEPISRLLTCDEVKRKFSELEAASSKVSWSQYECLCEK